MGISQGLITLVYPQYCLSHHARPCGCFRPAILLLLWRPSRSVGVGGVVVLLLPPPPREQQPPPGCCPPPTLKENKNIPPRPEKPAPPPPQRQQQPPPPPLLFPPPPPRRTTTTRPVVVPFQENNNNPPPSQQPPPQRTTTPPPTPLSATSASLQLLQLDGVGSSREPHSTASDEAGSGADSVAYPGLSETTSAALPVGCCWAQGPIGTSPAWCAVIRNLAWTA